MINDGQRDLGRISLSRVHLSFILARLDPLTYHLPMMLADRPVHQMHTIATELVNRTLSVMLTAGTATETYTEVLPAAKLKGC